MPCMFSSIFIAFLFNTKLSYRLINSKSIFNRLKMVVRAILKFIGSIKAIGFFNLGYIISSVMKEKKKKESAATKPEKKEVPESAGLADDLDVYLPLKPKKTFRVEARISSVKKFIPKPFL